MARYDLHLSDEQFGQLTLGQFDALVRRREEAERREWMRTGTIAAAVMNFSMNHPDRHVEMMDFVPRRPDEDDGTDLSKLTPEQQANRILGQMMKRTYNR